MWGIPFGARHLEVRPKQDKALLCLTFSSLLAPTFPIRITMSPQASPVASYRWVSDFPSQSLAFSWWLLVGLWSCLALHIFMETCSSLPYRCISIKSSIVKLGPKRLNSTWRMPRCKDVMSSSYTHRSIIGREPKDIFSSPSHPMLIYVQRRWRIGLGPRLQESGKFQL